MSGVGNFISARRLRRSWAPLEKAPLRLIPKSAILGAPLLAGFRRFRISSASAFPWSSLNSFHAFAYFWPLARSLVSSCEYDPWQKWTSQCSAWRSRSSQMLRRAWNASFRFSRLFGLGWLGLGPWALLLIGNRSRGRWPPYIVRPSAWFPSSNLACSSLYRPSVRGMDVTRFPVALGRLSSFRHANAWPLIILVRRASL